MRKTHFTHDIMTKSEINADPKPTTATGGNYSPPFLSNPNRRLTLSLFVGRELVLNLKKVKFDYGDRNSGGTLSKNLHHIVEFMGTMCSHGGDIQMTIEEEEINDIPGPEATHTPTTTTMT